MHRKMRSWLTVIGIIIGIAAIVTLISVSQGLENAIVEQFEDMGINIIYVFPKTGAGVFGAAQGAEGLTTDDADFLEGLGKFDYVNPYIYERTAVEFDNIEAYTTVMGMPTTDADKRYSYILNVEDGRWWQGEEDGSIMIGNSVAHKLFDDEEVRVNNKLDIGGEKYDVIGIFERVGNEQDDTSIYVTLDDAREIYDKVDEINFIELVVMEGFEISEVAADVKDRLERYRDAEDIDVYSSEQLLSQFGNILDIVQLVLGGIAAISLLVGGIGIMNSMFTNVLERKKEIGIMKSIGAGPKDIMMIFIVEAGLLGFVGGLLGVILGSLIAFGIGWFAELQGFLYLSIQVEWWLAIAALLFAFGVGVLSGYLPARQAAKLLPVEALRE
tara:strand:+ start:207 stop:1361 length:1155 start_codon:yes stop_codon:yes gene_type:complete